MFCLSRFKPKLALC